MHNTKFASLTSLKAVTSLLRYTKSRSPSRFWAAVLVLTFGIGLEGASIFLLLPLIAFVASKQSDINAPMVVNFPDYIGGFTLSLYAYELLVFFGVALTIVAALNRSKTLFVSSLVLDVCGDLRTNLFYSISRARWGFISGQRKADLDHLLNGDIERMQGALSAAFAVIQNAIALLLYTLISIWVSPAVTALALLSGIVLFALSSRMRRLSFVFGESYSETRRNQHRFTADFLGGLKSIKSYSAEYLFFRMAQNSFEEGKQSFKSYASRASLSTFIIQTLNLTAAILVIYATLIYAEISIEDVLFLFIIFLRINPRFSSLQNNLQQMLSDAPAFLNMKATVELCDANAETEAERIPAEFTFESGDISLDNITYSLNGAAILDNINICIKSKELTVICGRSGSGKTTLADLIMGLVEPTIGSVSVDNRTLHADMFTRWRKQVAYVPQQSFVLAGSIRENLVFGGAGIEGADIKSALSLSNAQTIVDRLPQGLETRIGDGGVQLSGGELQRLALARALVRRPRLLILDEVTSGLDANNRDLILEALLSLKQTVTVLMISHDEEIIKKAPQLIQLENGRVTRQTYNPPLRFAIE